MEICIISTLSISRTVCILRVVRCVFQKIFINLIILISTMQTSMSPLLNNNKKRHCTICLITNFAFNPVKKFNKRAGVPILIVSCACPRTHPCLRKSCFTTDKQRKQCRLVVRRSNNDETERQTEVLFQRREWKPLLSRKRFFFLS